MAKVHHAFLGISLLFLLSSLLSTTEACSCMMRHPQTAYCNANYVIIARILRQRREANNIVYKIQIKKSYKMNGAARTMLSDGKLRTHVDSSMCGMPLAIGKLYVIAGRTEHISICDYVTNYSQMTVVERRGFAGGYKKGCLCSIEPWFGVSLFEVGTCDWKPFDKCTTNYGACVPSRGGFTSDGKPVKCHWRSSPHYNACLNEP